MIECSLADARALESGFRVGKAACEIVIYLFSEEYDMLHVSLLQGSCCSSSPWRTSWALYPVCVLYYRAFTVPYETITPDSPKGQKITE